MHMCSIFMKLMHIVVVYTPRVSCIQKLKNLSSHGFPSQVKIAFQILSCILSVRAAKKMKRDEGNEGGRGGGTKTEMEENREEAGMNDISRA